MADDAPTPDLGPGAGAPVVDDSVLARDRLRQALVRRPTRGQWFVAVLCALLGFGIVLQVRTVSSDQTLESARPEDLVRLLDSLDDRSERLSDQIRDLEATRERLAGAADQESAANAERAAREIELGILAGTVAATGPGIEIEFTGPADAALLLDTVQELRDAGAEAQQVGEVRIVASTSFVDGPAPGTVVVDGVTVTTPFRLVAIGDAATMSSALRIPGGVADSAAADDVGLSVTESQSVVVDAVRDLPRD
jgi:uncharacterized protein YlxW (UPF0749 family)